MEWAKNQTLLPEASEADAVFQPFLPTEVKKAPEYQTVPTLKEGKPSGFTLSQDFWAYLVGQPWIKEELEKRIEDGIKAGVQKEIDTRFTDIEAQIREEARKSGYADGLKQGNAEGRAVGETEFQPIRAEGEKKIFDAITQVGRLGNELLAEKKKILADHERVWCKALKDILVHFQVEKALNISAGVEGWMEERMKEFSTREKLQVFLSSKEFSEIQVNADFLKTVPWEFMQDDSLSVGQMRVECGDGGLFFSRPEWLGKLDEWLRTQFPQPEGQA